MTNEYYNNSFSATRGQQAQSVAFNSEFAAIEDGFDLIENNISFIRTARKSADYTVLPADTGYTILHPNSDTAARTWTLQADATAEWPDGTWFVFVNNPLAGELTITTADTLRLEGLGTIASLVIYPGGSAKAYWDNTEAAWTITYKPEGMIRQLSKSADYTLVLTDAGKHIYHPSADTTARTWTIPSNSSVAFPIGTVISFVNDDSAGDITIAITTDTLRLAGSISTGSRTLLANGLATIMKVTATSWFISGSGVV